MSNPHLLGANSPTSEGPVLAAYLTRNAGEEVTVMGDNPIQNRRRQTGLEILAFELNLDARDLAELIGGPWDYAVDRIGSAGGSGNSHSERSKDSR